MSSKGSAAPLFAALGDATRLRLLGRLSAGGPLSITRLSEGTGVTRQAITRHLHALGRVGLVRHARRGRSQLVGDQCMFGPDYTAGCPSCSAIADGFNGPVVDLPNHGVTLAAVSRAPLAKLQAYKRRMGWGFPWASSSDNTFNYDFHVTHTKEEWEAGAVEYNFRSMDLRLPASGENDPFITRLTASVGT